MIGKLFDDIRLCGMGTFAASTAQLQQDIFALSQSDCKRNGYFVEVGAADGIMLSNTYLLESKFGWQGIVAEPGLCWHADLRKNRRCAVDTSCIWASSGQRLTFCEYDSRPEYSAIAEFEPSGLTDAIVEGEAARTYEVETTSLLDLLTRHKAPAVIDYLSIDTEGSEFDILAAFDFSSYDVKVITVEHNYTPQREQIHRLLDHTGYQRCLTAISKWDDWYVKKRD